MEPTTEIIGPVHGEGAVNPLPSQVRDLHTGLHGREHSTGLPERLEGILCMGGCAPPIPIAGDS